MAEIDKIKTKIVALLEKTVDNGCTEHEAMLAAQKAGEMLDHYQLTMTDIQIKDEKCVQVNVKTGGIKRGPADDCTIQLARYCDVKLWFRKGYYSKYIKRDENDEPVYTRTGKIKYVSEMNESVYGIFGLKEDCELFEYLFSVIKNMIAFELKTYQESEEYLDATSWNGGGRGGKLSATMSFQQGMASGISTQLYKMKEERKREMRESTGRDLVIVKDQLIKEEFANAGIRLVTTMRHRRGGSNYGARNAGQVAGANVNLNGGLNNSGGRKAIA